MYLHSQALCMIPFLPLTSAASIPSLLLPPGAPQHPGHAHPPLCLLLRLHPPADLPHLINLALQIPNRPQFGQALQNLSVSSLFRFSDCPSGPQLLEIHPNTEPLTLTSTYKRKSGNTKQMYYLSGKLMSGNFPL